MLETSILPEGWQKQSLILILISLMLSITLHYIKKFRILMLSMKYMIIVLIGYPLGEYLNTEILLLITIILETVYFLPVYYSEIMSLIMITHTFFSQKPSMSWGILKDPSNNQNLLFLLFISILVLVFSVLLRNLYDKAKEYSKNINRLDYAVEKLSEINLDYQSYAASIEHDSIESERKRISREMHDIIGYTLTNQLMIIQAALSMKENIPDNIKSLLEQSLTQTNDGMVQARSALYKLREFSPEKENGIKLILKLTTSFMEVTGINIKTEISNAPDSFGEEIDKILYRFIQESLTNAFRHGKATQISIILHVNKGHLHVNIWDNGKGSEKITEGIGISGMRERLNSINGELEIKSLNSGFTIRLTIPLQNGEEITDETTTS